MNPSSDMVMSATTLPMALLRFRARLLYGWDGSSGGNSSPGPAG
jgi:hypothetical protein